VLSQDFQIDYYQETEKSRTSEADKKKESSISNFLKTFSNTILTPLLIEFSHVVRPSPLDGRSRPLKNPIFGQIFSIFGRTGHQKT